MSPVLAITGLGLLTGAGPADVTEMFDEPLPRPDACVVPGFSVRERLGRKGTSFLDRATSLAMVACMDALADTELDVHDGNRSRVGVVLGTAAGSMKSTSDFSRDTFIHDKPYRVNPLVFPNAVMNSAAGQSAIRFRLHGANATIAGGVVPLFRYARTMIGAAHADALLVGSVEELSPQAAWALHHSGCTRPAGEGAAVFVVEDAERVRAAGRLPDVEVLAAETYRSDPSTSDSSLARCLTRALDKAGVTPTEVAMAAPTDGPEPLDTIEEMALNKVLGATVRRSRGKATTGETVEATGSFQLAALVSRHRADPAADGEVSVLTTVNADGQVGAMVIRGWHRAGSDHR